MVQIVQKIDLARHITYHTKECTGKSDLTTLYIKKTGEPPVLPIIKC